MIYEGKEGLFALFREHYENTDLHINDIHRREISINVFSPELKGWSRHLYFQNKDDLKERTTQRKPPAGLFSSTAYYLDPNEKVPRKRDLIGCDFVIDLDDDMLDYENRFDFIDDMRKKTKAIIDRFLPDLGFDLDEILIDFSGKKGFHLTFETEALKSLDQPSRRQIIDYIMATKLNRDALLEGNRLSKYGWNKQLMYFISKLVKDPSEKHMQLYFAKNKVKKISSLLSAPAVIARLKTGSLVDFNKKVLVIGMMKEHRINIQKIVDKKPTVDLHRTFRVPGSLHPGSGLPCVRLTKYHLNSTELIIDEIMAVAGEDEVTVKLTKEVVIDFPVKKTFPAGVQKMKRYEALPALIVECKKHWYLE